MQKSQPHWLPLAGTAEFNDGSIRFLGKPKTKSKLATEDDSLRDSLSLALLRSNVYFSAGDISGEFLMSAAHMTVQFRLGSTEVGRTTVGLNIQRSAYAIVERRGTNIRPISLAGTDIAPPTDRWTPFEIQLRGSQLSFFVDGVQVVAGQVSISRSQVELLLDGVGTAELRNLSIKPVRPQLFVVMQFTDEYTTLYDEVIKPVCGEFGYEVIRGDNVYTTGLIVEDIARSIRDASVVLADITPNNPNVYYEVGFSHGIGKPTILLSDRARDKLPFDLAGFRLLFYDNTIGGKAVVEAGLRKHLEAIRA